MQTGECPGCRACTGEWGMLSGLEKHDLEKWVEKHPRDPVLDGPPEPVPALGPDGMIYGERPSMNDQLMYMIASWIWKEATGEWE
jgi:hypothetical protein